MRARPHTHTHSYTDTVHGNTDRDTLSVCVAPWAAQTAAIHSTNHHLEEGSMHYLVIGLGPKDNERLIPALEITTPTITIQAQNQV